MTTPHPHPAPPPDTDPDVMRADYRHFWTLVNAGSVTELDAYRLIHVCVELGRLGYVLNADETDWVLKETEHDGT